MGAVRDAGRAVARAVPAASVAASATSAAASRWRRCSRARRSARSAARRSPPRPRSRRSRCRRCARYNYSGRLATATLAAGGTLGILIPPSVVARRLRDPDRAEHRQAVRRRDDPRHHRRDRLPDRDRRVRAAASGRRDRRSRATRGASAWRRCVGRVAGRGDLRRRVRRHLRRRLHADRGRGRRRGGDVRRRPRRSASSTCAGDPRSVPRHRRDQRHDLHDLPRRRHAELGARAVADAGAARATGRRSSTCRRL